MVLTDIRSKEFSAGLGSAVVSMTVMYPATKCVYRQILENAKLYDSLLRMKKEGIFYLYRGIGPPMIQRCTELSIMFGVYRTAEMALRPLRLCQYQTRLASSAIAGCAAATFAPPERIQVLLMDSKHHHHFRNMAHAAFIIGNHYGLKEYYRGFTVLLIRNVLHNMFFFTSKAKLYEVVKQHQDVLRGFEDFIVGSVVGFSMTTIFYPIKVVKTYVQRQLGGEFETIPKVIKVIYARDNKGIVNFYRGISLNVIRAFFGWGITNICFEFIKTHI